MSAWIPGAIRKAIPPGSSDPAIIPVGNIFHVAVSEAASLHDFFNGRSGGIESHGYVRRDGTLEQYRDAFHEADANYRGNSFIGRDGRRYGFLSWETQGMGPGEWTPEQLTTIKRIISWTHGALGVPLRVAPAWNQPGNGYHTLFPEWSNVPGKTCPGPDRIKQFHNIIAPWLATGAEEDDMAFTDWPQKDQDALVQAVAAEVARIPVNVIGEKGATIGLRFAQARTLHAARTAAALETTGADDIAAAVVRALPQGRIDEATVAAGVRRALAELLAEEE